MTDKMTCARSIRNLAALYRDMEAAAETLESLGSIEQAQKEADAALQKTRGEVERTAASLKALKVQEADQLASLKVALEALREKGEAKIASLLKDAEVDAAEILKRAQDKGAELVAQAVHEKARLSSELAGLQSAVDSVKVEIEVLGKAKEEAETQAQDAQAKLAALKTKLKAMLD